MRISFISYWGYEDPLCTTTVIPHVHLLQEDPRVSQVHLLTFERCSPKKFHSEDLPHHPIFQPYLPYGLHFPLSYLKAAWRLLSLHKEHSFDLVICRSVFAGVLGHFLFKLYGVPYTVESFEPHASYMIENGVWQKNGIKARFFSHFESMACETATKLLPVSENFATHLKNHQGVPDSKITTVPCTVEVEQYAFSEPSRARIRSLLDIPDDAPVVIYVGKFGGVYLGEEAINFLVEMLASNSKSYLLLLSDPEHPVCQALAASLVSDRIRATLSPADEVSHYLSAADIGLVLTRPTQTSDYCSSVKVGEYWANGLPILTTTKSGDDSAYLKKSEFGLVATPDHFIEPASFPWDSLWSLAAKRPNVIEKIQEIARTRRSRDICRCAYRELLDLIVLTSSPS